MSLNNNFEFSKVNRDRTKKFALRVIKLFQHLPKTEEARIIGKQLLRSGTSVGSNYRAVCRSRSNAEFVSKLNIVLEEADESSFWMELLMESEIVPENRLSELYNESIELTKIFSKSISTSRSNKKNSMTHNSLTHN